MSSGESEVPSSIRRGLEDRVMEIEVENSRLRRLVAELLLNNQQLRNAHLPDQTIAEDSIRTRVARDLRLLQERNDDSLSS
jgi:hypothetical protein